MFLRCSNINVTLTTHQLNNCLKNWRVISRQVDDLKSDHLPIRFEIYTDDASVMTESNQNLNRENIKSVTNLNSQSYNIIEKNFKSYSEKRSVFLKNNCEKQSIDIAKILKFFIENIQKITNSTRKYDFASFELENYQKLYLNSCPMLIDLLKVVDNSNDSEVFTIIFNNEITKILLKCVRIRRLLAKKPKKNFQRQKIKRNFKKNIQN